MLFSQWPYGYWTDSNYNTIFGRECSNTKSGSVWWEKGREI